MTSESGKARRRYGARFKVMVLAQCDEPGASVAQGSSHGINDNVVHRWRQLARQREAAQPALTGAQASAAQPAQFVPLALPAPAAPELGAEIRLEVKRAGVSVIVGVPYLTTSSSNSRATAALALSASIRTASLAESLVAIGVCPA